ncbi:hypothetical protein ACQW02_16585 [Humitalea sp. 24SJ18S-53]|uniref:hypothetical protein n=1 Tax=Humitalea sp. 24SJ18S-53 TaxID=3422307 RepID=UPI003D67864A
MAWSLDARIPVFLCADTAAMAAHAGAAMLLPEGVAPPAGASAVAEFSADSHVVGCNCCAGRLPAAVALDRLFLDRVRGNVPFFRAVAALASDDQVQRALAQDAVVGARFRPG